MSVPCVGVRTLYRFYVPCVPCVKRLNLASGVVNWGKKFSYFQLRFIPFVNTLFRIVRKGEAEEFVVQQTVRNVRLGEAEEFVVEKTVRNVQLGEAVEYVVQQILESRSDPSAVILKTNNSRQSQALALPSPTPP